jgi:hypothetical protein
MAVALLLADRSPALRMRTLTELMGVDAQDAEVRDLAKRIPKSPEALDAVAGADGDDVRSLSYALCRLANLGLDHTDDRAASIAKRLFASQKKDGSWPVHSDRYDMVPLQTATPLRGIAAIGLATDPRAERAYEWLLDQRLDDGTWPTGVSHGHKGYTAGYRRLPRSEGCRSNTTAAIACFVHHPERRLSDDARRPLDILLGRETRDEWTVGYEVARLVGVEKARGWFTFYQRFDLAFVLELASRAGASADDGRVADLVSFLDGLRGSYGLWEHRDHPQLSRWLTLHILSSLARLGGGDWTGTDLRVSFRPYAKGRQRY